MKLRHLAVLAAIPLLWPLGHSLTQLGANTNAAFAETGVEAPELLAQASSDPEAEGEKPREGRKSKWLEQLNLTPEQQTAIQSIRDQAQPAKQELRQKLRQEWETMRSLLADSNTTRDQLRAQHQKMLSLRQEMGNQRFETMLDIRDQLTPEQQAKLAELRGQHRGRHGGRWGRFR